MRSAKERRDLWRKGVAVLAAAPMLLAMIPTSTAVAADTTSTIAPATSTANNVLDLGFDGNLTDNSAAKNTVTAYKGTPTYVDGVDGQAVKLDAGALALGASQKLQPENLSLSFWWNPTKTMTGEQILMWGKGKYNENGWYLSSASDTKPLVLSIGTGNPQPLEFNLTGARADIFPANTWTHVMVTFDAATKTAKFYINGESKAYTTGNTDQPGKVVADDTTKYIGWNGTHASGGQLTGLLDDVELWNVVANTADVENEVKVGKPDFDAKALAQKALDNVNIPTKATSNLTFNTEASNGATIFYESGDTSVIANDGTVTRPAVGAKDATVTVKVTVSYGSAAVTKDVVVTVPAQTENGGSDNVEYLKNYLSEQGMNNVQVDDAYLQNAGTKEVEYLLSFEPKRLLVEFRANAGLSTKDADGNQIKNYGGWENGPSGARNPDGSNNPTRFTGHFVGHWISAVSQAQRSTFATAKQKEELAANLQAVVTGLRETQEEYAKNDAANAGFFPAFPVNYVPNGDGRLLVPFYNLHKVEQGLVLAYEYGTDATTRDTAKAAAVDFAKWIVNWKAAHANTNMLSTEYGGMNDALYQVAEIADANDKQVVLQAAHLFDETTLFQNLADGKDVLNGLHANTTIPKLTGAMQRYVAYTEDQDLYNSLSADEQEKLTSLYLKAAKNFFDIVVNDHTYVNGGNSQSEHFHAADALWHDATQNGDQNGGYRNFSTVETCNEYNMLKLARILFQVTKDSKYSEYYEHTFINAIVASQNPETGMTTYFQPMKAGYPKVFGVTGTEYDAQWFGNEIGEYWCCQGTGIENFAKLNDSFYFTSGNDVYVNMFWSSTYTDTRHGLTIKQTSNVPKSDKVTFDVTGTGTANLKLRLPDWAIASKVKLTVNGKDQSATAADKDENGWLTVANVTDGTKIEYTLPARLQAISAADNKNWVAFQYGPVVLAGALTETNYKTNYSYGGVKVRVANYDSDANAKAAVIPTSGTVTDWLKDIHEDGVGGNLVRTDDPKSGNRESLTFKFANVDGDAAGLELHPYYSTYKTTYAIYWDLAEVDSDVYQQNIIKKKSDAANQALVSDAVDAFDNEFQQELAHNAAKSDDSNAGTYSGKQYRDAKKNGWFSYDLSVKQGQANWLATQYYSGDKGRTFKVIVDPTPVADNSKGEVSANAKTYDVAITDKNGANAFYWDTWQLPDDLVAQAKDGKVRVLYKSDGGDPGYVGGVYGVRIQNEEALSADATLKSLTFDKGTLSPKFDAAKSEYTLTVPADTTSVESVIGVKDAGAYVKVNGIVIDDTKARAIAFNGIGTKIDITSYAQDHKTTKTYTVNVIKEGADISQGALEEFGGISTATGDPNASITNEGALGKVVNVSGGWVGNTSTDGVPTKAVGTFVDPSVFNKSSWTLNTNVRIASGLNDANADKRSAITIGTKDQGIALLLAGGKLGYGANNSGLSAKTAALSSTVIAGQWATVTIKYTENANSGVVAVSIDGKQVLAATEIGFKLSTQTGTGAYLGHGFNTSFLLDGTYDYVTVSDDTKPASADASLKSLTVAGSSVDLEKAASEAGASVEVDDPAKVGEADVEAAPTDAAARPVVKVENGVVTVTVTAEDGTTKKTYTVKLTKKAPVVVPVESVAVSVDKSELTVGETAQASAVVAPENATDKAVVWASSDEKVATVDASGKVTAVAPGSVEITATAGGKSGKVAITVKAKASADASLKSLTVAGASVDLEKAASEAGASVEVADPAKVGEADVEAAPTDAKASAKVEVKDSVVTVTVTAEDGTQKTYTVKLVKKAPETVPVDSVAVSVDKSELTVGETAQASATVAPEDATDKTVAWTSSDEKVATVDASGKVTAVAPGTVDITATAGGKSGKVSVTVKAEPKPTLRFTDVTAATPHADDIQWLAERGISTGWPTGEGTAVFSPMGPVVRQDMAAFLYRLAGSPEFTPSDEDKARFTDVDESTPHYKEVLWLASTGIAEGFRQADGSFQFGGNRAVVRQDMAAFLKRLADYQKADPVLGEGVDFTDVDEFSPHAEEIDWLAKTGVAGGFEDGSFGGMRLVVRQDMAAFLHRMDTNVLK